MKKESKANTRCIYISVRVRDALQNVSDYPLTLVEAPMGYGKTTAVREFLSRTSAIVLWQHCYNDSAAAFWNGFCRQFSDTALSEHLISLGLPSDSVSVQTAIDVLEDLELAENTMLVIDDFHLIRNTHICGFIEQLARRELQNLHIVLTGRFFEYLNIDELVLKGYAKHVTKTVFELLPGEIIEYYRACDIDVSVSEAEWLYAATEGWISALYLLMLDYVAEGNYENSTNIYKLLDKTIYEVLPDAGKELLTQLCIFDSFNIEQAIYVWGSDDAVGFVEEAAKKNAFVNYDAKKKTYQIHSIFTNLLKDKFESRDKHYQSAVLKRAAEWFTANNALLQAADFYFRAECFDEMLDVIEKDCLTENETLIVRYYTECPKSIRLKHPTALILFGMVFFSINEIGLFDQVCSEFMDSIQSVELCDEDRNRYLGEFEMLLSFTKYNNISSMSDHHQRAYALLGGPSSIYTPSGSWTFGSPSILYMFYRESGGLQAHVKELRKAMDIYNKLTNGYGNGAELVMEAEYHFHSLDFINAEITVTEALHKAQANSQKGIMLCALFLQIRLSFIKGDFTRMTALFKKMREVIYSSLEYLFIHTIQICEGFIYALLDQTDKIAGWINEGDFGSSILPFPVIPMINIVYGRVQLIREEYTKLIGSAQHILGLAAVYPNLLGQIYAYIYTAAANRKLFRQHEALEALRQALSIAMPDQILIPFAENADYIMPLLKELSGTGDWSDYITKIIEFSQVYSASVHKIKGEHFVKKNAELTSREREIAVLAADGLSNGEIGKRLFISPNTVKMALKSIFTKLEINSRALIRLHLA